jgi:hypothetical protein
LGLHEAIPLAASLRQKQHAHAMRRPPHQPAMLVVDEFRVVVIDVQQLGFVHGFSPIE